MITLENLKKRFEILDDKLLRSNIGDYHDRSTYSYKIRSAIDSFEKGKKSFFAEDLDELSKLMDEAENYLVRRSYPCVL